MTSWRPFHNHLRSLLWKMNITEEVECDLEFHLEMRKREFMEQGMREAEAQTAARERLGDVKRVKKECRRIARERDRRYGMREWCRGIIQDLSFALRQLRKAPSWTFLVILTFAAGIAANSVVFSVVNAVILRPYPWPEPERIIRVRQMTPQGDHFSTSGPNFIDFRDSNRSFASLGAIAFPQPQFTLLGGGEPENISALACTGSLFSVLGIAPELGRTFLPSEDAPGSQARVTILSHGIWLQRFGADPTIVGSSINLNGEQWTVVGVMPESFQFPIDAGIWVPHAVNPGASRGDRRLELFGRLEPGVSSEQALQDLRAIAARLSEEYPEANKGWSVDVVSFIDSMILRPPVRRITLVLQIAVGLMLLLACASVSNLLLSRATSRRHEIGIRASLGAGKGRILRQLLTEASLLALLGAVLGLVLTYWALPLLVALNPAALPRLDEVSVDRMVLLFTLLVSLAAGLLAGLAPALQISQANLVSTLREGRGSTRSGLQRLRDALVIGELALAVTLLIGAGLLVNSLRHLQTTDPGFRPDNVLLASIALPQNQYPEMSPQVSTFYRELLERVRAIPGVVTAGASMVSPYSGLQPSNQVGREDALDEGEFLRLQWRAVTPDYFRALGVPLIRGRFFDATDRPPAAPAGGDSQFPVIVSDALAHRLWPGEDAIGKRLQWSSPGGSKFTVIGMVPGVRDVIFESEPEPMIFLPHDFVAWPAMTVFVKTAIDPASIAGAVRGAVWDVDPNLSVPELMPLDSLLTMATAGARLNTRLLGLFAAIALLVAAMGVYGVVSYAVTSRTREIGVRVALGARTSSVVKLVISRGLRLIVAGLILGLIGAVSLSGFLESLLYEVSPTHWMTYAIVALLFAVVGTFAACLPASRAARIDPVMALRQE